MTTRDRYTVVFYCGQCGEVMSAYSYEERFDTREAAEAWAHEMRKTYPNTLTNASYEVQKL